MGGYFVGPMIHLIEGECNIEYLSIAPIINSDEGWPIIKNFPTFYGSGQEEIVIIYVR